MPKTRDGKVFPYNKKGMQDMKKHNSVLDKKKKKMGNKGSKKTSSPSY
ncbi:MAG: hypothetical protein GOVbin3332_14 [Prokaryotic dsDNA virus sp.]|nr:MAG: hypothetical protein GOVbin3332_14 [Prokaryotic dsDNA virus sp.]|tara:strand:+ start:439 stop:582 length:144 start_codon:yes stop_codon:yes gene_type:complete